MQLRKTLTLNKLLFTLVISVGLFILANVTNAADTTNLKPLATVPFVPTNGDTNDYINALYTLSITAASLLVVVKIILGGVKYMFSEVVTSKQEAKKDIQNALLGLLIIISAVLILNTINPSLTDINFLRNAGGIQRNVDGRTTGSIGSSIQVNIGDTMDRNQVALDQFNQACTRSGGQTAVLASGSGTSVQRQYYCGQKTEATASEYEQLLDQTNLSEEQKNDYLDKYETYIKSNANLSDTEILAAATAPISAEGASDVNLSRYINENIDVFNEAQSLKTKFVNDGLSEEEAQSKAVGTLVRENSIYIQSSNTQSSLDQQTTVELCQVVGGTYINLRANSGDYMVCMK